MRTAYILAKVFGFLFFLLNFNLSSFNINQSVKLLFIQHLSNCNKTAISCYNEMINWKNWLKKKKDETWAVEQVS